MFPFCQYIICSGNLSLSKIIGGAHTIASFYSVKLCVINSIYLSGIY